tara:strand:+ start:4 stop:150 length:147 start_codon:yes stop_codon:yes gene_type:complete
MINRRRLRQTEEEEEEDINYYHHHHHRYPLLFIKREYFISPTVFVVNK